MIWEYSPFEQRLIKFKIYFTDWSYNGATGPEYWQKSFPVAASEYQSPLNIDTTKVIYDSKLKSLVFDGYRDFRGGAKVLLQNNGSTVKVSVSPVSTQRCFNVHPKTLKRRPKNVL